MPLVKPTPVSDLPPVAPSAWSLVAQKYIPAALMIIMGGAFLLLGALKPLAEYIHRDAQFILLMTGFLVIFLGVILVYLLALEVNLKKSQEKLLAYIFGVVFIAALFVVAIMIPNPTPFQIQTFRIILSLAAAGVAGMFTGFLNVNVSTWIKAGGALGVFVVVYFFAPSVLPSPQ